MKSWNPAADRRRLECIHIGQFEVRQGDRVRLRPRRRADIFDMALDGMTAAVETIEEDYDGRVYLAVTVDEDPGRDLGALRLPGHRFFFLRDEIEPLSPKPPILIAGIGNIFLGDDAFGVEVAQRLARHPLPDGVRVIDFGIRGIDLTYALLEGYESAILLDATPRGGPPGTLYVVQPEVESPEEIEPAAPLIDMHTMDPAQVLRVVQALGGQLQRIVLVGCEPLPTIGEDEIPRGLSHPVEAAVDEAIELVESLIARLQNDEPIGSK